MPQSIKKLWALLLDTLFPPVCLACKKELEKSTDKLCPECADSLQPHDAFMCAGCGARLPDLIKICHKDSDYILAPAARYENETAHQLIWRLKYERIQPAAEVLADLIERYLNGLNFQTENYYIVPIPLHSRREMERGFNQSKLIGEILSKKLMIPIEHGTMFRTRHAKPQIEMKNWEERRKNLAGSFDISDSSKIAGKNILLIDDVSTSGATLSEAASVLKLAGAKKIIGLVVAKAG